MSQEIELYLFDLGGVVLELSGSPLPGPEMGVSEWLFSSAARDFETGRISKFQFAEIFKKDHCISESVDEIIEHFRKWPKGFYPGAVEFLSKLSARYRVAALSNTNEIHWPRIIKEFRAGEVFEEIIASHIIGIAKPDLAVYRHALCQLNVCPESVVFIDDNESNVLAAKSIGINSYKAKGFSEVLRVVCTLEQSRA